MDLIPDKSLKNAIKPDYYGKVEDILNRYMISRNKNKPFFRLNKKPNKSGNFDILESKATSIPSKILK